MKPLNLQGHSRPVKYIKFSENGELLFTASSDRYIILWKTKTGEKIKTFSHSAAVNTFTLMDNYLISGDNTGSTFFWNISAGTIVKKFEHDPILCVRSLEVIDKSFLISLYAGRTKKSDSFIDTYNFEEIINFGNTTQNNKPSFKYEADSIYSLYSNPNKDSTPIKISITNEQIMPLKHYECSKNTKFEIFKYLVLNTGTKCLIIGKEDGSIELLNYTNGSKILERKLHEGSILDIDIDLAKQIVLTSGKDGSSYLISLDNFDILNEFKPTEPVRFLNSCKICSIQVAAKETESSNGFKNVSINVDKLFDDINLNHLVINENRTKELCFVIIAGGQDNKLVTTTNQKQGGFEVIVYDIEAKDKIVLTLNHHFGPVNTLAFSKQGNVLASGAEDSTVKIYNLEEKHFIDI